MTSVNTTNQVSTCISKLTDQALYGRAKFYGENALVWRRKFIGLLPEVNKRKLYERKGFSSVFEFAFKLAGLSEQQVRTALNLERRFSNTPVLKSLLETGEVSVNKLVRIQSIATPQNEAELADTVKVLPQSALETLIRDEKIMVTHASAHQKENGLHKPQIEVKSLRAQTLQLSDSITERLLKLQEKGLDVNEILTGLLDKREQEIEEEKAAIVEEMNGTAGVSSRNSKVQQDSGKPKSRYIPARIRKIIHKEHGTKCSIPTCYKPAEHLHHTQTFALSRQHDPHYLAPLCKNHHTIAHAINLKVQEKHIFT